MQYKIKLQEMEFHAYHGCYDLEQKVGNKFIVNVEILTSQENISDDDVLQAVNYLSVYEVVAEQMKVTQRTIECVAHNIIDTIKHSFPQVEGVECEVCKVAPPLGGKIGRVSVVLSE